MNSLIVSGFGTSVFVEKRKLIVKNNLENKRTEFYPHQIGHDSIVIDGHTGVITFEAMRWIMKHNINLTLLNWNGNLLANTLPSEPKNGKLRVMQYEKYLENKTRFQVAMEIVRQKVDCSFNLLKELSRYYSELDAKQIEAFEESKNSERARIRENIKIVNNVMGHEAVVAAYYWDKMAKVFNKLCTEFRFKNRPNKTNQRNMNAADEVNALLNYGYAILESEVRKALNAVGLDPTIGFLHEVTSARTALVYDIQELFRWLVDLSVIQLLEEKKLKKSDFITTENYHIRLKADTAKMLVEKINSNFNMQMPYKSKNYSYQSILLDNVQRLANFLLDKNPKLNLEIPSIRIQRNDTLSAQQKILNMSPSERKQLGINKSTLWYQKKNLTSGKTIKIYRKVAEKIKAS